MPSVSSSTVVAFSLQLHNINSSLQSVYVHAVLGGDGPSGRLSTVLIATPYWRDASWRESWQAATATAALTGRRQRSFFNWEAAGGGDGRAASVFDSDGLKICLLVFVFIFDLVFNIFCSNWPVNMGLFIHSAFLNSLKYVVAFFFALHSFFLPNSVLKNVCVCIFNACPSLTPTWLEKWVFFTCGADSAGVI